MHWQPIGNKVLVKKLPDEDEITPEGIYVVSNTPSHERYLRGEVVAVGPGTLRSDNTRIPMSVSVGDIILYPGSYGTDIGLFATSHSNEYLLIHDEDIAAIII